MYYPLSQITTNLYTNGKEYQVSSTGEDYTGYYWKTSKNEYFTGKTPQDTPVNRLIPFSNSSFNTPNVSKTYIYFSPESDRYLTIKSVRSQPTELPSYSQTLPTQQDYQLGEMRRYFCKKSNEFLYLEIDMETYNKLLTKSPTIAYQYYIPFNIPWKLKGFREQVYKINKDIVELAMKQQKLPMFNMYLKEDYTKYIHLF